ncbi:MAG: hypothetical protein VXU42_04180, partial [Verrucomicrobiota bacterium]|nr:hypothetical protein [Verrucomicrobiota bacterium]
SCKIAGTSFAVEILSSGADIILGERLVILLGLIRHGSSLSYLLLLLSKREGTLSDKDVSFFG